MAPYPHWAAFLTHLHIVLEPTPNPSWNSDNISKRKLHKLHIKSDGIYDGIDRLEYLDEEIRQILERARDIFTVIETRKNDPGFHDYLKSQRLIDYPTWNLFTPGYAGPQMVYAWTGACRTVIDSTLGQN